MTSRIAELCCNPNKREKDKEKERLNKGKKTTCFYRANKEEWTRQLQEIPQNPVCRPPPEIKGIS